MSSELETNLIYTISMKITKTNKSNYRLKPYNPKYGFDKIRQMADSGDQDAQYQIGKRYFQLGKKSVSVSIYWTLAAKYLNLAVKSGHIEAQYKLGLFYLRQDKFEEAVRLLQLAGDQMHLKASSRLVAYCRQAAAQGNPDALFYLGRCYEKGIGVDQDIDLAVHYYCLAAGKGHSEALSSKVSFVKKELESIRI